MGGRLKLGQILVNRGLLEPDQLAAALAEQHEGGARLGMTLVRMGVVDEETLIRTLAGQLKLPVARIRGKRVSPDVLECVPVDLAEKHRCLPLFFKQEGDGRVLFVAMEDPSDSDAVDAIASASGEALQTVLVGPTDLEEALQRHYHWASLTGESPDWSAPSPPGEATGAGEPDPSDDEGDPDSDGELALGSDDEGDPVLGGELDLASDDDDIESAGELGLDSDDEGDPLGEALLPEVPGLGEPGEADTTPELTGGEPPIDGDAGELADPGHDLARAGAGELAEEETLAAAAPRPESLDPRIILRALSQLLVEKGVIGRDEFVQRLGELAAREARRG